MGNENRQCMRSVHWEAAMIVVAFVISFLLSSVSGSHFQYGTISWVPHVQGGELGALFTLRAAFHRDNSRAKVQNDARLATERWPTSSNTLVMTRLNEGHVLRETSAVKLGYRLKFPSSSIAVQECEDPLDTEGITPPDCTPWSHIYGMFFGDGKNTEVILTVDYVSLDKSNLLRNYIHGYSIFFHIYEAASNPKLGGEPWLAFFAGGDRLQALRNNANGRYCLQVGVDLTGGNRSPIVTQIPILPVPRLDNVHEHHDLSSTGYDDFSPDGPYLLSKIYIGAMDEDMNDNQALTFRVGNEREYGGLYNYTNGKVVATHGPLPTCC